MQDEHSFRAIPRPTLERLPKYLNYLRGKSAEGLLTTSSTAIAQDMEISLPSATVAVKKLEKKGFVLKSRGAEDGRRVYVQLTESGRRAEVAHRYFHRQMLKAVCQDVREADKPALLSVLRSLNEFFDKAVSQLSGQADQNGGMQP